MSKKTKSVKRAIRTLAARDLMKATGGADQNQTCPSGNLVGFFPQGPGVVGMFPKGGPGVLGMFPKGGPGVLGYSPQGVKHKKPKHAPLYGMPVFGSEED
jgi:hypothetical protein